ncbi:hypothetical protein ABZZ80_38625 [Streptomyces sp. NPDC006356]
MRVAQRLAALAGSAVLAATGLTALTATPAEAATCVGPKKVRGGDWGQVFYSVCSYKDSTNRVFRMAEGRVTDLKTDGCNVKATIEFVGYSPKEYVYTTGSSRSFETGYHVTSTPEASLSKVC